MTFILNLAIGLIFVFLVFSLVVSAANELVLSLWKRREQLLREGIGELLHDRHFLSKACDLYSHPLIAALSRKENGQPNYIPKQTFVSAVLDLITPANAGVPRTVEQIKTAIQSLTTVTVDSLLTVLQDWATGSAEEKRQLEKALQRIKDAEAEKRPFLEAIANLAGKRRAALALVEQRANLAVDGPLKERLQTCLALLEDRNEQACTDVAANIRGALPPTPANDAALQKNLQEMVGLLFDKDFDEQYQKLGKIVTATQLGEPRSVLEKFIAKANPGRKLTPWTLKAGVGVGVLILLLVVAEGFLDATARQTIRSIGVVLGTVIPLIWHFVQTRQPEIVAEGTKVYLAAQLQLYLSQEKLRASLTALLDDAEHELDVFKVRIGDWFDNSMRRVTGWYKNQTQYYLFALGLILAAAANVDAIHIMRYLAKDPTAAANFADAIVQATAPAREKAKTVREATEALETSEANLAKAQPGSDEAKQAAKDVETAKAKIEKAKTELDGTLRAIAHIAPATAAPAATPAPAALSPGSLTAPNVGAEVKEAVFDPLNQTLKNLGGTSLPLGWSAGERSYFLTELTAEEKEVKAAQIKTAKEQAAKGHAAAEAIWNPPPDFSQRLVIKLLPDDGSKKRAEDYRLDRSHCFSAVLGFVLTALAGSLGAPFWFDMLNKVITVRSAGKKPEEQPTNEKKKDANH